MSSPETVESEDAETRPAVDAFPGRLEDTVIDGRYEVDGQLGAGGMGAVYLAQQKSLDRKVVIKVLHPAIAEQNESVRRFFVEARAASAIQHPNIVEVIDYGELPSGAPFLVMEHIDGMNLARLLARDGPLRWSRVRVILLQVLGALKAAHAADILHRDIKPSNVIVLAGDGPLKPDFVKVVDFGIAKFIDAKRGKERITAAATVLGTASYLAPEMIAGAVPNPRTEVYAVGVLAFKMLTGEVPFRADGFLETLRMAAKSTLPELKADLTEDVRNAITKALARDPDARYASISEFESVILTLDAAGRRYASGPTGTALPRARPTLERRVRELEAEQQQGRRASRTGYIVLVALALVGMLATWWLTRQNGETPATTPAAAGPSGGAPLGASPPHSEPAPSGTPAPAEASARAGAVPDAVERQPPEPSRPGASVGDSKSTSTSTSKSKSRSKPKSKSKSHDAPEPRTDAGVLKKLSRTLKRACNAEGVVVRFTVKSSGRTGMVTVKPASDNDDCIRAKVRTSSFPAGDLRALRVAL